MSYHSFEIPNILKYRPSALLTDFTHTNQLLEALKLTCKEQLHIKPYFIVKNKDMIMRIQYENILYFESSQRIITLHCKSQQIKFYAKLTDVQSMLPMDKFVRCHQSYLVNIDMVKKLDTVKRQFQMITGENIEISKSYYPQVQTEFSKK